MLHRNVGMNGYVIALTDGIGGFPNSDIAAQLACEAAVEYIVTNYKGFSFWSKDVWPKRPSQWEEFTFEKKTALQLYSYNKVVTLMCFPYK